MPDYPVFTRKAMTDLCYLACARKLLARAAAALSAVRHPQRAHRRERDRGCRRRRGLRIPAPARHGRGALRARCSRSIPGAACRVYAPVGGHRDLLAYLVRRLLENGANSSFVVGRRRSDGADRGDPEAPAGLDRRRRSTRAIRSIPLPRDLYAPERRNSAGVEFGDRASARRAARRRPQRARCRTRAAPLIDGDVRAGRRAHGALADRRQGRSARCSEADDARRRGRDGGGAGRLCRLGGDAGRARAPRARTRRRSARSARAAG